ncbi:hypothetical protein TTHERM_01109860 (macronuclear) [Tetrahymena thermophila SB210]|uniref:Uncharacterized protein n=1 Tax=Tetrahymena thermophila (strain SB210) TaxID=312017 RepID=Q22B69_TETTS|nr:hypothetical protein TTHERM_01109860 [Tetrahymena thermophila SB210]EAR82532.2 hypothetical protein TTHERM_01109860 [Tetrahymena thermophila SB210]|eukprot:XP_001030195.2 hypothetical protein TTHERM_01109860 [Tetrahymena thermophila SB210]
MKQLHFDNNFKSVNGINLMKELENAPQKHYGNTQLAPMQPCNDLDYRSRRNVTKIAQILHQQNYQQVDQISKLQQNKQQQQSVERLIAQNQELNSSNNQSKNTSSVLLIPAIKDLNQERILQRLKSRTIHSEQSSPKMEKNTPSNMNSDFSSYQCNFPKDFSPKVTEQNTSQNSIGFNQLSNLVFNQCSVARSQSREKELIQSTNLNSLESEWSKIKKEHNFDNRSQSPFRFHSPVLQGQQHASSQLSSSNIGNESKISNSSNNNATSSLSRQFADYQFTQKNEWCSSLERSADSTKKPFENNSSSNTISQKIHKNAFAGEYKQKQKTLIKKSVPLSKINLELVKQEQLSGRQLTAGRKTPKSSQQQQNQKSSQIIISQVTPNNNQYVQSSNSLSNRQHRSSQDNKDESHFQTILDKYQNVHKRQQVQQQQQQNLNMSNLSNNSSNSFQPTNYQCISTQPLSFVQNNAQDINNISSFETSSFSAVENKRNSIYDSRQSFNFKLQKEDSLVNNGVCSQTSSQQIYNFTSKVINPSNYYTSPGFTQNLSSSQLNQHNSKTSSINNSIPQTIQPSLSCNLQSNQAIQNHSLSNQAVMASQSIGKGERTINSLLNEQQKNPQSSSKIHNQIKVMSPKQNDLKSISQRNNLNKQNSSENISSCQQLSSSQIQVEQNSMINSIQKGGLDDVELTTSKYYGKSTIINQQERDVKQIIMNKIHKMNVAKICLKDEDLGSLSYNNCSSNNDIQNNNFQNGNNNDKNETEINRCQQQNNLISYSPISSTNYERNQILNSSPQYQNNLSSSACQLQVIKPVSQMPIIKYQPQSESKKIQGKTVNSNTTSPDKQENISKVGEIEYKLKQIGQQNQQQAQYNRSSYILQNNQNTNNMVLNQYQIQQPAQSQLPIQILNNSNNNNVVQEPFNSLNKNMGCQPSQNNIQTSSKYQINLAQILQSDTNKLKESNTFNQENLDKKNQGNNNSSQYHVFSSNSNNSASSSQMNQNQIQQQYSSQQSYYQRINPLQVSTNINRIISQKVSEQNKITQIKPVQNIDQFNYYSKPISQHVVNKNFILQPQLDSKTTMILKNQQQIPQQQTNQISLPADRAFLRSNSSEGQFQIGQLQTAQVYQKQQNQKQIVSQNHHHHESENNYKTEINKNGTVKIEYPNQHANNIISYQNNICLSYKQNTSNNTNNQYNTIDRDVNTNMQIQNQEKQLQYQSKQFGSTDQNQLTSNQSLKYSDQQQGKRSFLNNQPQNNHEIPKIKKTSSFFAH